MSLPFNTELRFSFRPKIIKPKLARTIGHNKAIKPSLPMASPLILCRCR